MSRTMVDFGLVEPEGIEGLERLKIPQSSFTLNRRARPPPIDVPKETAQARMPLNASKLSKQESKGGIRSIFNRHKAEKAILSPNLEGPEMPMKTIEYESLERSKSEQQEGLTVPATPSKSIGKPSRMNLRARTGKVSKPASKPGPSPNAKSSTRPTRTSATWDPPPLFQAFPQAIKHAQLAASTLSADSIIRISNHKRNSSITEYTTFSANSDDKEQTAAAKKTEKARNKHRRQISGSISKADWTQKIFVLVTSGYLLQYASEGSFDRLPEKMMLLGKDSVAFASDVIPGKHWVLQISQSMDEHGTPASDSRSLLSRLTFRGSDYKRTATSLLLVLDSAEEMDSWIAVVRREIEALGGKKYVSDTVKPKADEKGIPLREKPSHRHLIQKDPDKFSNPASPSNLSFGPRPWDKTDSALRNTDDVAPTLDSVHPSIPPPTNHQSATNSIASQDGQTLDELRNSAQLHRLSYMSSGQRTLFTSQFSSRETSPTRESSLINFEDSTPKASMEESQPRPDASAVNERRRSMQTVSLLALESQPQQTYKTHRHSTYGPAATPNFSVPNSSSRRFSAVKSHSTLPGNGTTTGRSPESTLKGARKAPPPALTVARPLSPVTDDPSPHDATAVAPTGSSLNSLKQITASVIDIAPRSPLFTPSLVENSYLQPKHLPQRRSSHAPLRTPSPSQLDFQFPRRSSSVMTSQGKPNTITNRGKRGSLVPPEARKPQRVDKKLELPPLPAIANTKTKLRRPTSMQIRPSPYSTSAFTGIQSKTPNKMPPPVSFTNQTSQANRPSSIVPPKERANYPSSKSTVPALQHLEEETIPRSLGNRRSMPFLVGGPPPAPPPDCALPALPPPGGVRTGSSSSGRTSLRA